MLYNVKDFSYTLFLVTSMIGFLKPIRAENNNKNMKSSISSSSKLGMEPIISFDKKNHLQLRNNNHGPLSIQNDKNNNRRLTQGQGQVLVFGSDGEDGNSSNLEDERQRLATALENIGCDVELLAPNSDLPDNLSSFCSIWNLSSQPLSDANRNALAAFFDDGGSVFLNAEANEDNLPNFPFEALNDQVESFLDMVAGGLLSGITITGDFGSLSSNDPNTFVPGPAGDLNLAQYSQFNIPFGTQGVSRFLNDLGNAVTGIALDGPGLSQSFGRLALISDSTWTQLIGDMDNGLESMVGNNDQDFMTAVNAIQNFFDATGSNCPAIQDPPSKAPTKSPSFSPMGAPTQSPSKAPIFSPTQRPTSSPTQIQTSLPQVDFCCTVQFNNCLNDFCNQSQDVCLGTNEDGNNPNGQSCGDDSFWFPLVPDPNPNCLIRDTHCSNSSQCCSILECIEREQGDGVLVCDVPPELLDDTNSRVGVSAASSPSTTAITSSPAIAATSSPIISSVATAVTSSPTISPVATAATVSSCCTQNFRVCYENNFFCNFNSTNCINHCNGNWFPVDEGASCTQRWSSCSASAQCCNGLTCVQFPSYTGCGRPEDGPSIP